MGTRLSWRDASGQEGIVDLGYAEVYIGRAQECIVRTDDPMVSRRHARIYFQDGRHILEDLGSANGIFIGDQRTQVHPLTNGDNVRLGNLWVRYLNDGMPAPAPGGYGAAPPMGGPPPGFGAPPPGFGAPPPGFGAPPPMGGPPPAFGGPPPAFGGPPPAFGGPPPMGGPPPAFGGPPPMGGPPPGFGPPPMGGPPPGFGPPPSFGGAPAPTPMAMPAPTPAAPLPPTAASAPPPPADGGVSAQEAARMQRRIDQLSSEVRMLRGGGDKALRMEELETKITMLERDKLELQDSVKRVQAGAAADAGDLKVQRANLVLNRADEVVNGLNDVLSELRINLLAAEGEVEQWASTLPKASFELVRESLRSCRTQMETAKDLMRQLRDTSRE